MTVVVVQPLRVRDDEHLTEVIAAWRRAQAGPPQPLAGALWSACALAEAIEEYLNRPLDPP